MLIIGKVLKPHGVRGSLKVQSFMDTPYAFSDIKSLFINNNEYKVEKVQPSNNSVIIKLTDLNSFEDAEKFRNAEIVINKDDAPDLPEGRFYIEDLIGCEVFMDNKSAGKLVDVLQYGSADIYCVEGAKKFMFPYVGDVVQNIDIKNKTITLNKEEFQKVAVYED